MQSAMVESLQRAACDRNDQVSYYDFLVLQCVWLFVKIEILWRILHPNVNVVTLGHCVIWRLFSSASVVAGMCSALQTSCIFLQSCVITEMNRRVGAVSGSTSHLCFCQLRLFSDYLHCVSKKSSHL